MRLIDADKIRYRDMSDGRVVDGVWYTFMEDIRKQPTVKAIPVEWIKKYIENHTYEMVNPKYVDDTYNYIKFTKEPLDYNLIVMPIQVKAMLADWEKENDG